MAVTCAEPPAPVAGAVIDVVATPAAVMTGDAIVPRLVLKLTWVGAATTTFAASRSVAVILPVAPQAIDAGPRP